MRQAQADLAAEAREKFEETQAGGEAAPADEAGPVEAKVAEVPEIGFGKPDSDEDRDTSRSEPAGVNQGDSEKASSDFGHDHAARKAVNAYEKIASLVTA